MCICGFGERRQRASSKGQVEWSKSVEVILPTFITLLLVPVLYAIFVLDLKIVKWEKKELIS
jgi:hypothetical protein